MNLTKIHIENTDLNDFYLCWFFSNY